MLCRVVLVLCSVVSCCTRVVLCWLVLLLVLSRIVPCCTRDVSCCHVVCCVGLLLLLVYFPGPDRKYKTKKELSFKSSGS